MRAIQIVVTPGSGEGRALATAHRIRDAMESRGWTSRLDPFDDLGRLARWSATCSPRFSHLVSVGGDATVSASAMAAIRHRRPLLPVPAGFGNLFAGTFGHTDDVDSVVRTIETGDVVWVDAGVRRRSGGIFLCHESYGLIDEIQEAVEDDRAQPTRRALRLLAYYRMGLRFLLGRLRWSIRVEVDDVVVARRAVLVTVANVRAYGEHLALTPDASPTDGLLDIVVIPRTTKLELCRRLLKLFLRLPPREDEVVRCRGRRVAVTVPGRPREELRIMPAALPVLVPARDEAAPPLAALQRGDGAPAVDEPARAG